MAKSNLSNSSKLVSLIKDPLHWDLLMGYVAVEKERIVIQLLQCDESALKLLQGEMKALKNLENLESQLKTEESTRRR